MGRDTRRAADRDDLVIGGAADGEKTQDARNGDLIFGVPLLRLARR